MHKWGFQIQTHSIISNQNLNKRNKKQNKQGIQA